MVKKTTRHTHTNQRSSTRKTVGCVLVVMGARWLVGGRRRLGKATSSIVVFFEEEARSAGHGA